MQSPAADILDFQHLFDLDHNIPFSPLDSSSRAPDLHTPNPPSEANRNRARNPRSCDFCRGRKTACIIESTPPCTTCKSKGKECAFSGRPPKRRRPDGSEAGPYTQIHVPPSTIVDSTSLPPPHVSPSAAASPPQAIVPGRPPTGSDYHHENLQRTAEWPEDDGTRDRAPLTGGFSSYDHGSDESLELQSTATAFLLGDTGEADPYLLKRPSLASHAENIKFRQIHRDENVSGESEQPLDTERPLVFMLADNSLYDKYEPRVENAVLDRIREDLDRIGCDVGARLISLHLKHIYPYFPVLSRSLMFSHGRDLEKRVASLPLALKAAVYASAVPFMIDDDYLSTMLDVDPPSAQNLYRMAWIAISHEIHTPHLSTLQACLLLLQRDNVDQFVQWSPFQTSLAAWTVGLAQSLGLSTDCSTFKGFPAWEKRLRRRLWWATYVLDKWTLLTAGLTSHIKNDDFDVLPLATADLVSDADGSNTQSSRAANPTHDLSHFCHLVRLTTILSDIHDTFFTIRASKATSSDYARTLDLSKPLRSRLYSWKESFDRFRALQQKNSEGRKEMDGNVSLGLAYLAVTMLLYRAMIRPFESSNGSIEDSEVRENNRQSVRLGARACCVEIVEYLEQVQPGAWNAFWHKFSRSYFAIASSFMMRLLITSNSQDETNTLNNLIHRWRWAMRIGGGNSGSQLMSLGLLRLDRTLHKSGIRVSREESGENSALDPYAL